MHVLVTGGAGFIGRHLVPILLERGHEVSILDSLAENVHGQDPKLPAFLTQDCRFVTGDIRDPDAWALLDDRAPEAVIHLAAETGVGQSMYEIGRYTDVNIQGTSVMLDQLRDRYGGVGRIVVASSRAVYGEGSYRREDGRIVTPPARSAERLAQGLWEPVDPSGAGELASIPTAEDAPRVPTSVYAMTKSAQEDLVQIAGPTLGASTAVLRYANVYGEGQPLTNPYTGVLSAFALRLVHGQQPSVYEDGQPSRDFVHVADVAMATALATESDESLTANVGSGERWTLEQIARRLTQVFGMDPSGVVVTGQYRVGDIRGFLADIDELATVLGFQPAIGLGEGLQRFGSWVSSEATIPETDVASMAEAQLRAKGLLGRVAPVGRTE